ncbi:MAG: hypothetical protein AAF355_15640, partial [Myxococcota bacterium]
SCSIVPGQAREEAAAPYLVRFEAAVQLDVYSDVAAAPYLVRREEAAAPYLVRCGETLQRRTWSGAGRRCSAVPGPVRGGRWSGAGKG